MSRAEELKALVAADNRLSFEEARTSRDVLRGTEQSGETVVRVCWRVLNQECISNWIILNRLKKFRSSEERLLCAVVCKMYIFFYPFLFK